MLPGFKIILFDTTEVKEIEDVLILDKIKIDIIDEEAIYELCMNYNDNKTIEYFA